MIIKGVKVNYGIVDKTLAEDSVDYSVSSASPFMQAGTTLQNTDKVKIAYLEENYMVLDGTFIIPDEGAKYNVGWESNNFGEHIDEYVEYQFGMYHSSYGITLRFPQESVAKDFIVQYYDNNTLVGSIEVVDNENAVYSSFEYFANWNRVRIVFERVNSGQRARLYYVVFGINTDFNEDTIISISASKNIDLSADYSDAGEVAFEVYNDGVFDVKSIRELPIGFQEGQRIIVYVKKDNEENYNAFSGYYSQTTTTDNSGKVLTITGYDALYQLNSTIFRKGKVYPQGRSLGDWAREVADDCGIMVTIDASLDTIISKGYITEVPHREALRLIAEAGCCVLKVGDDDVIEIAKPMLDYKGEITQDDIVDGTEVVENAEKILGVSVAKYTYSISPTTQAQEIGYLEEIGLSEEEQEIEIVYSVYPVQTDSVQVFVANSAQIVRQEVYSDRIVLGIVGDANDSTFVTITGKAYNVIENIVKVGSTLKNVKNIASNFLITGDIAQNVAEYQYLRLANIYHHSGEILSDKDLKLGDLVNFNGEDICVENIGFSASYEDISVNVSGTEIIDG